MSLATITLDTHRTVKFLLAKGYSEDQAEGFVDAIREINLAGVATKEDMDALRAATRKDMDSLKEDIHALRVATKDDMDSLRAELREETTKLRLEIKTARVDLYKFMFVQAAGIVGLTVTLIKMLPHI